jgi:hypothetical protein
VPSRWTIAIALFFATFLSMNGIMIWVAVRGADTISPSYTEATQR